MKTKINLMAPVEEGTSVGSGTNSTATPSNSGPSETQTATDKLRDPKTNPWADETERNTAQGVQIVKPAVTPVKPTPPVAPSTEPTGTTQAQAPAQTPPAPTAPVQTGQSLDPKALAKEFAAELRAASESAKETVTPVSDEEFDAHFGMPKIDANTYTALFGFAPEKPEQVAALAQTLRGVSSATLRMANQLMQERLRTLETKMSQQFAPALQATQEQLEARVQDEFFKTYPGLKDQIPLLLEIRELAEAQVKLGKLKFTKPEEIISYVAEKASKFLGRPVESFKTATTSGGAQGTTQNQSTGASRQMTTASTGGRTGGAGSATSTKPKTTAESLFGRNDD